MGVALGEKDSCGYSDRDQRIDELVAKLMELPLDERKEIISTVLMIEDINRSPDPYTSDQADRK